MINYFYCTIRDGSYATNGSEILNVADEVNNAIIVDNAFAPSFVFGEADGSGMFKKELSQQNLYDLSVIKSLIIL